MTAVAELLDCLTAEAESVERFIGLLETEAALLTDSDSPDDLLATIEAKQAEAARLEALGQQRAALAVALGESDGSHAAMQRLARQHADIGEAWDELLDLAEHARRLNQRNGALIDTHLRHTQMSLDALRSVAGLGNVYDASGRAQALNAGKTIATG